MLLIIVHYPPGTDAFAAKKVYLQRIAFRLILRQERQGDCCPALCRSAV